MEPADRVIEIEDMPRDDEREGDGWRMTRPELARELGWHLPQARRVLDVETD